MLCSHASIVLLGTLVSFILRVSLVINHNLTFKLELSEGQGLQESGQVLT